MKLNYDCIRDVLLEIEKLPLNQETNPTKLKETLTMYSSEDIIYTCIKLEEAKFISASISKYGMNNYLINIKDITYLGHQFLADIHSDTIWNDVKAISKKVGSNSIKALTQIATSVVTEIIKHQLGFI